MQHLYDLLTAANHSVSLTAHWMEMEPSDSNIAEYESALDYAARIRASIGAENDRVLAELDARVMGGRA